MAMAVKYLSRPQERDIVDALREIDKFYTKRLKTGELLAMEPVPGLSKEAEESRTKLAFGRYHGICSSINGLHVRLGDYVQIKEVLGVVSTEIIMKNYSKVINDFRSDIVSKNLSNPYQELRKIMPDIDVRSNAFYPSIYGWKIHRGEKAKAALGKYNFSVRDHSLLITENKRAAQKKGRKTILLSDEI